MKNYKKFIATAMAILTITSASCLTLTGCGCSEDSATVETTAPLTEEVIITTTVETPYGDLKYEKADKKDIIVDKKDKDGCYTVTFKTKVGKKKVDLFEVQFGEGSGNYVGTVKKDKKKVDVYLNGFDIETDGFKEDELDKIYGLQENINPVNDSILEIPSFEE